MRVVVVLSLASLPIGVWALLRALRKPEWLALLALPLVYNRAFFWGFVNFQLALGLALLALAILVRPPRGIASELALAMLCALIVFTHPYGLLILAGILCLWLAARRAPRALAPRARTLAARARRARLGASGGRPAGAPTFEFEPLLERLDDFEESVLGGYRDASEAWLLIGFVVAWARARGESLPGVARALARTRPSRARALGLRRRESAALRGRPGEHEPRGRDPRCDMR